LAAIVFVIANWKEAPDLRWIVAGVWYNDYFRISAMLPVAGIIIASIGAVALVDAAARQPGVRSFLHGRSGKRVAAAAVVLVLLGVALAPLGAVERGVLELRGSTASPRTRYCSRSMNWHSYSACLKRWRRGPPSSGCR
jgi:hypothetical protein